MSLDQEIKRKHKINNKIRNVPPSVSSVANKEHRKIVKYKDQWSFSTGQVYNLVDLGITLFFGIVLCPNKIHYCKNSKKVLIY